MPMGPGTMSPGGGDNNMNMNMNMSMDNDYNMMHSSLFWGKDAIVLFSGWPNHSLPMYILACFFVFSMAVSIELLNIHKLPTRPVVEACVYALRMTVAYLLMLSVMSFNIGIFLAAVIGHSVGMFVAKVRANRAAVMVDGRRMPDGDAKI